MTLWRREDACLDGPSSLLVKGGYGKHFDRREFLTLASIFGAVAFAGQVLPREAYANEGQDNNIWRVAMRVYDVKDPRTAYCVEAGNIMRQVLEPLVMLKKDNTLEGRLLSRWTINEDATEYTLHLRPDVFWNNGDAFTADDVVFNIHRWCDAYVPGNSMAVRMSALSENGKVREGSVIKLDELTVQLRLSRPDVTLLPSFADYPALVVHRNFDVDGGDFKASPVGTGPFELASLEAGKKASFRRRENGVWWGGTVPLNGVKFIDYGADSAAIFQAFENKSIHSCLETSADQIERFNGLGLWLSQADAANTLVARMKTSKAPYSDTRVRKAFQMAVDNASVLQLGLGGAGVIGENHHVSQYNTDYAELPALQRDIDTARNLMNDAGQMDAEHELISREEGWQRNTGDAIAAQLREAGFKVGRKVLGEAEFWDGWKDHTFSLTTWLHRPLAVQTVTLAYMSNSHWNETGYSNAELDAKIIHAQGIIDDAERKSVMSEIERILQDSGIIIQPYWRRIFCHSAPEVRNFAIHPSLEIDASRVWLDS